MSQIIVILYAVDDVRDRWDKQNLRAVGTNFFFTVDS